jgi:hypothetical protein
MGKLIHQKEQVDKFNIGFEFEIYVKKSVVEDEEVIPPEILKKYGHLMRLKTTDSNYQKAGSHFLKKMQEYYPQTNWKKCFEAHEDGSLNNYSMPSHMAVEMVMKHDTGSSALTKLKQVISVLNCDDFFINNDCGLHVNISFKDNPKNRKDLVIDVSENLDIKKILNDFGRSKNEYCTDNNETEIDLHNISDEILTGISRLINPNQKNNRWNSSYVPYKLFSNLKKPDSYKKFMAMMEKITKDVFVDQWTDDRPAIAPKRTNNKNYLEFRLMGGKDYQTKYAKIENGINEFLKAMNKADLKHRNKTKKTVHM